MTNPRRVAAGKRNRALRGPLSVEGVERLREAAKKNQPWHASTGPRSLPGKKIASQNAVRLPIPSTTMLLALASLATLRAMRKDQWQ